MKRYTISPTQTASIASIASALADYYGSANITIHFRDATNIIFTCPAFPKIIKVTIENSKKLYVYCGDSYQSGTNINNSKTIHGNTDVVYNVGDCLLLLDVDAVVIIEIKGDGANGSNVVFFGKASNNQHYVFACTPLQGYYNICNSFNTYNVTTNTRFYPHPQQFNAGQVTTVDNKILKFPFFVLNENGRAVTVNDVLVSLSKIYLTPLTDSIYTANDVVVVGKATRRFNNYEAIGGELNVGLLFELDQSQGGNT